MLEVLQIFGLVRWFNQKFSQGSGKTRVLEAKLSVFGSLYLIYTCIFIDYRGILHYPVLQGWWEMHHQNPLWTHLKKRRWILFPRSSEFVKKKVVGSNDLRAYVSTPNQQGFYQNSAGIPLLYYDRSTQMSFHRSSRAQFHTSNEDSWGQLHFTLLSEYIICVYSCIYTYCNIQWLYSLWFSAVVDYSSHVLNGTGSYLVLWYLPQKGCALITNLRQQPFRSWLRPIPRGGAISTFAYLAAGFGF